MGISIMNYILKIIILSISLHAILACQKQPPIDNTIMLDGDKVVDETLNNPQRFLISQKYSNPTDDILNKPVLITVHGYSATTYEWREFYDWHDSVDFEVSLLLLGGHGRSYNDFANAKWEDWQKPIIEEYNNLTQKGFKNISLLCSSTACPLVLNLFKDNSFDNTNPPRNVIFIDPIIVASNKTLSIIKAAGPILGYVDSELDTEEIGYWYNYRPQESLQELQEILTGTRKDLQKGITPTATTNFVVYKSISDPSADPVSAPLIYQGLKTDKLKINMVDTDLHVFTRLAARKDVSEADRELQLKTFNEIKSTIF